MRRSYVTAGRLVELERGITDRDQAVLDTLGRVRLATSGQLERLHFPDVSVRRCRQVLVSLVQRQLIARLPRVIGGVRAGSAGHVYSLDVAGARLVHPGLARPQRPWSVGLSFLKHALAVTELYVRLVECKRSGDLKLLDFTTEPGCWRSFYGPGGGRLVLKPDAAVTVQLGPYEDRWFVELDRGTESRPTIQRKAELYRRYWQSGTEQARSEVFPRVLWVVPDDARYEVMTDVLGRLPAEAWQLFGVAVFADAVERIVAGAVS